MASTARAIAGISRSTAAATLWSSALMIRSAASVESVSMPAEAGLGCSVRSFSSTLQANTLNNRRRRFGGRPYALKVNEILIDRNFRNCLREIRGGALQFCAMMRTLVVRIAIERSEPAVRAAIGVQHQDHPPGAVQPHGFPNLLDHEL